MLFTRVKYTIEKTKDDKEIIRIINGNKSKYIGSKYNMNRELLKFEQSISSYNKDISDVFLIYGFATGDHIKYIRNKYPDNMIVVYEPNRELTDKYIKKIKWIIDDENITILSCDKETLINTLKKTINEFNYKNSEFMFFSNYRDIYKEESKEYFEIVNNFITSLQMDLNTKLKFQQRWFSNTIKIIPYVLKSCPADLYKNEFKNIPAVIVSAGPSLSKNIKKLKQVQNNMLILTGGRTLKALIDLKIKPDLLAITDSNKKYYKLVKDYIEKVDVPLLFYEGTENTCLTKHNYYKIFYSYDSLIFKILGRKIENIETAGSVSHFLTSYAAMIGCNPIIFIGQDFAYKEDKMYGSITSFDVDCNVNQEEFYIKDNKGGKVKTNIMLNQLRLGMEEIISHHKDKLFINATEGGAEILGTVVKQFDEVIEKCSGQNKKKFPKKIDVNDKMIRNAKKELTKIRSSFSEKLEMMIMQREILKKYEGKFTDSIVSELLLENKEFIKQIQEETSINLMLYKNVYEYLTYNFSDDNVIRIEKLIRRFNRNNIRLMTYSIKLVDKQLKNI